VDLGEGLWGCKPPIKIIRLIFLLLSCQPNSSQQLKTLAFWKLWILLWKHMELADVQTQLYLYRIWKSHEGVFPIMYYMGMLRPKGVPFWTPGMEYIMRLVGSHLVPLRNIFFANRFWSRLYGSSGPHWKFSLHYRKVICYNDDMVVVVIELKIKSELNQSFSIRIIHITRTSHCSTN